MNTFIKYFVVVILLCILLFQLYFYKHPTTPKESNKIEIILPDSSKKHRLNGEYLLARKLQPELNLKNLELGTDSIEVRVYLDEPWTPQTLLIIKNEENKWSATEVTIWSGRAVVDSYKCKNILPKCSWNNIIDSLTLLGICNLPSQRDIQGFHDYENDGFVYSFEVATKRKYKFFDYHDPKYYKDKDNKTADELLKFISREIMPIRF